MFHLPEDGPLLERFRALDVRLVPVPVGGMADPRSLVGVARLATSLVRHRIGLLHTHDYYANIVGAAATLLSPGTRLVTSRRWRDQYVRPAHRTLDRWAYRRSRLVLVNSEDLRTLVAAETGLAPSRIALLPNFVDDADLDIERPRRTDGRLVVGSVGRLSQVKNLRMALDVMAVLMPEFPTLEYHICGDGEQRDEVARWVRESPFASRISMRGLVPSGPAVHREFDITIHTSISEGSPNSVLEAMAAGTPLVATAVGGVPELIADGIEGRLVPSNDVAAMVAALRPLLAEPTLREAMGARGRRRASERRESRVVAELLSRYEKIASKNRARAEAER